MSRERNARPAMTRSSGIESSVPILDLVERRATNRKTGESQSQYVLRRETAAGQPGIVLRCVRVIRELGLHAIPVLDLKEKLLYSYKMSDPAESALALGDAPAPMKCSLIAQIGI